MNYSIIEDCSPYYIRYTHVGIDNIIAQCIEQKSNLVDTRPHKFKFIHCVIPEIIGESILEKVYGAIDLKLRKNRVSLFVTQPGHYYRPHRDGLAIPMGINYTVDIKDDKCVTSWYDNETFKDRPVDNLPTNNSREIADYNRKLEKGITKPVKSMIAQQGEAILFNTDLYHDVDNSESTNERTVLTLRSALFNDLSFMQARNILFGY